VSAERPDQALARRLVAHSFQAGSGPADARKTDMPEPMKIDPPQKPAARPQLVAPKPPAPSPYGAGVDMLSEALSQAQDIARRSALQLAETGLHQSQALIALQETLLGMAHANMAASFAAAQKILASTTLNEALAVHTRFAQDQVAALTGQAAQLRNVATRLTGEGAEPWAEYWSNSFARIREAFKS
jgi:phasin family protein